MKIKEVTTFVGRQITTDGNLTYYRYAPDDWYYRDLESGHDISCGRMMCEVLESEYQEYLNES